MIDVIKSIIENYDLPVCAFAAIYLSRVYDVSISRANIFLLNNIFLRDDGEISNNKKSINQQHNLEFQVSVDKYNKSSTIQL